LDRFLPHRSAIGRFLGAEVEWLAEATGNAIGLIARGTTAMNWGYVVLRRNDRGEYVFWDLQTRIGSRENARTQLTHTMDTMAPPRVNG
jgi:hypothetical protein